VHTLGSVGLMLCALVLLEISARLLRRLSQRAPAPAAEEQAVSVRPSPWSGMRLVLVSPYLRAIGLYILPQSLTATFLELQINQLVYDAQSAGADRTAEFAIRDMWVQGATLFLQLFVTGRLLTRVGM
jgi:AAA family ATP:ADP antiporter